jgi:hypothetical protein
MEYITKFSFTKQYQELGISFTLMQGVYDILWLENIGRTGEKDEVRELFGRGMPETI